MGATGHYIKTKNKEGAAEKARSVNVIPEDSTISISKTETEDETTFAIRTTFDGLEQLSAGNSTGSGYFNIIDVELKTNTRYTVLLLLTGGSYTPVYKDFAIYNIRLGYGTGGVNSNYALIQEYARAGNGSYVALEKISNSKFKIHIHTPAAWAYANVNILKENRESTATIHHYDNQQKASAIVGTIVTTEVPAWKNKSEN